MIGYLPSGSKGFDCNTAVSAEDAAKFYKAGYRFVVRYVRRATSHSFDLTPLELANLLRAGLGVMAVQHVANPGWLPTTALGRVYGAIAAHEAGGAGLFDGVTVWCDLEGVHPAALPSDVVGYCNAWYDAVRTAGFEPGLYVGDCCGLSAQDLYAKLKFRRYWSAYNLNRDNYPAVRGVQMRQHAMIPSDRVPGIGYEFDVNLLGVDAFGENPPILLP